mmetsp:Transcript_108798/g.152099  ORF Transcript_108798/g.152099 Transcript_108798/m.152099 type:complete len:245 (-) Transcript_108798:259-993(-)
MVRRAQEVVLLQVQGGLPKASGGPQHLPPRDQDSEVACAGAGAGATGSSNHPQHPASLPRAEPAEVCARAGARAQNPQGRHYQQGRALSRKGASPGHHRQEALHRESSRPPPLRGRAGAVASPHREQVQVSLRHCARLQLRLPFRQVVLRLVGCEEAMVLRAPAPGLPRILAPSPRGDHYWCSAPQALRLPRWLVQLVSRLVPRQEVLVLRPPSAGLPWHGARPVACSHCGAHHHGPPCRPRRI